MTDHSNLDRQIEQLKQCEIIKENEVKMLCARAREILVEEGNVQKVDSPVTVRNKSIINPPHIQTGIVLVITESTSRSVQWLRFL